MANIDQAEAILLLKALLSNTAYTVPGAQYAAIDTSTTAPTSTSFGSEASGGGYARAALSVTAAAAGSGGNAGLAYSPSSGALNYTNMPAGTFSSIEVFNAATGTTRRLLFGALASSKTLAAGDTLSIAAGQLTATLG
ncbi:hypothetical protein LQ327_09095 [Actinomycetospora endophytica]|uniref:Bacteriophage lambda head decoration protein D n=1 Tax=Actinomycetospora endophytica TaxID=2291215 RepID=A0ABS8P5K0_9PSEU|nr:hypothetical protein [Actinomycetospora endophytica]MCD2193538.1 hypothetical protein [Actinomycetospora endophytica]